MIWYLTEATIYCRCQKISPVFYSTWNKLWIVRSKHFVLEHKCDKRDNFCWLANIWRPASSPTLIHGNSITDVANFFETLFNNRDFLYGAVKVQIIGTNASKINIQGTDIKDRNILVQYFQRSVNFKSKFSCSHIVLNTPNWCLLCSAFTFLIGLILEAEIRK